MLPDYLFQYVFATSSAGKLEGNHPCSSPEVVSFAMIPNVASETPLIIFFTDIVVSLNFLKELITQGWPSLREELISVFLEEFVQFWLTVCLQNSQGDR
jgi:hypothetical protein